MYIPFFAPFDHFSYYNSYTDNLEYLISIIFMAAKKKVDQMTFLNKQQ